MNHKLLDFGIKHLFPGSFAAFLPFNHVNHKMLKKARFRRIVEHAAGGHNGIKPKDGRGLVFCVGCPRHAEQRRRDEPQELQRLPPLLQGPRAAAAAAAAGAGGARGGGGGGAATAAAAQHK